MTLLFTAPLSALPPGRENVPYAVCCGTVVQAVEAFVDAGFTDDEAVRYGTFAFFGGIGITVILDFVVSLEPSIVGSNACFVMAYNARCIQAHASLVISRGTRITHLWLLISGYNIDRCISSRT